MHRAWWLLLALACSGGEREDETNDETAGEAGPDADADTGPDAGTSSAAGTDHDTGADLDTASVSDTGPMASSCTTAVDPGTNGDFVDLCPIAGPVGHVVIENLLVPATHASAQLVFGTDIPPERPDSDLSAGELRVLFYGGSSPAPPPLVEATFGPSTEPLGGPAFQLHDPVTLCFDLHTGSSSASPQVALWFDGEAGVDCWDPATLSARNAFAVVEAFEEAGQVGAYEHVWFRQSDSLTDAPTITLLDAPVVVR